MMINDAKDSLVLQVSCQEPSKSSMEHLMESKVRFFILVTKYFGKRPHTLNDK